MNTPAVRDTSPEGNDGFIVSRGMKFPLNNALIKARIRKMLRNNAYEDKETDAALRVVREGDVVLEVGGGIGYMSTLVASKRAIASVHSFEANPHLIPYIRQVHAANFQHGGRHIYKFNQCTALQVGLNMSRPGEDKRYAHQAFVEPASLP